MLKSEIINKLNLKFKSLSISDTEKLINLFFNKISYSLHQNRNIEIRGFGSFIVKTRAEKTGRNISKNVAVVIPAHNIPAFKPSKTFVNSVKQNVPIV